MKKTGVRLAAAVMFGGAILAFTSCFYMPGVSGGKARAGLVLPRYLIANPVSLALIVGGPGMEPMFASYTTIPESITIDVPSGLARTFTVLLNGQSATLQGASTVDLQPGETKNVTVNPTVAGTQIVVPDSYNSRLVQISDMNGTGWTILSSIYSPSDVDFDNEGRIYAVSSGSITQMDDISGGNQNPIYDPHERGIVSIAMDRKNDLLYWANTNGEIWRAPVTAATIGPAEQIMTSSAGIEFISTRGIAVDSDGFVYVANNSGGIPAATILKINPNPASSPTLVTSSTFVFANPWDVLVNGNYVYVCDPAASTPQIVRLTKNLEALDSITGHGSDSFLGPEQFVAILNKPITVIDEPSYGGANRLISFNDITGAGWAAYGTGSGSGTGQFAFFNC